MALPDFDALAKEVDAIDTNVAIRGRPNSDERERLLEIINQLTPILYGGTSEHIADALRIIKEAHKLLGTEGRKQGEKDVDTTICLLCGQTYTGTPKELDAWEKKHRMKVHSYPS